MAPRKAGMAPSPGTSTPIPAATASSVSAGTPMEGVAVVSTTDASEGVSADSAACEWTHTHLFINSYCKEVRL